MGRRKIKEPDTTATTTPLNDTVSASPNIFETLFGGADQNAAAASSIFSDSNPFKRKPEPPKTNGNSSADADIQKPNVDELKQKKGKNKEEEEGGEGQANIEETIEKPKKVKTQNPDLSLELKEEKTVMESEKKRKKRKRDDLEKEYEAKKYGAVVESEDNVRVVVGEKRKKVDDAVNVLVSEETEGFDDESKLLRTVFVGNLPLKMKKKTLIKEFSKFGEVESVRIRSVPIADTKIPRKGAIILKKFNDSADSVHAYVVFKTEQSAEASLHHNMAVVGGNHIRVDRACPPRKKLKGEDAPLYDNKRTVFVGNLPFDVKDEEVYQLFCGIKDLASSIEAVRVVRDPHLGLGKGIAYIFFKTREAANLVVRKRNLKLRGRELRLTHARQDSTHGRQDSTLSKRKNSFVGETANSPSKKLAMDSRSPGGNSGLNTKAAKSYQGLRASKSGVEKKTHALGHSKHNGAAKMKSDTQHGQAKRPAGAQRTTKRPAVALRKAKAKTLKESGGSGQVGKKRKFGSRTPDSSSRNKKPRKFR